MTFDILFYRNFLVWAEKKGAELIKTTPLEAPIFVSEVVDLLRVLFAIFGDLASCFGGNFFTTAARVGAWAGKNRDPLATIRAKIRAMQTKWGA